MKTRAIVLLLSALLFSSCIIKSLQPFYIKKSLSFNETIIGNWSDNQGGNWQVISFLTAFNQDRKPDEKLSADDQKYLANYRDGYYIKYVKKEKEAGFIAMPFKVDDQYFLNFTPIEFEDSEINELAKQHLLKAHTVAKLDVDNNDNIQLSWLSEEPINKLFEEEKIRIKHEIVGFDETLLLTATSEELYAFLQKYSSAKVEEQWTKDRLSLKRLDGKP